MYRPSVRASARCLLIALFLVIFAWQAPVSAVSNRRHGISTASPSYRISPRQASAARPMAMIKAETPLVKPVSVVVHTFWGKESCFNTQLRLDCAVTDTGHSIKRAVSALTGIPVCLQRLFVSESVWNLGTRTKFADNDQISDFPALLRLRHDTKQPELHVLLEIPVPYSHNLRSDAGSIAEYAAALKRYSSLLSRVKAARKDPKLLLDPELPREDQAPDTDARTETYPSTGRVGAVDEATVGRVVERNGCALSPEGAERASSRAADGLKGSFVTPIGNDTVARAAAVCPATNTKRPTATGSGEAGTFVSPNRRMHLLFFHDYPTPPGGVGGRLRQWFHQQLPIDWVTNAKFALLCYLTRASCNNEPWVKKALLYAPPVGLLCQTRLGRLLCRSAFHMLPMEKLPKGWFDYVAITLFQL
ncbi:membrane protein, putative [Babesia bigemina]|uniref:Membrane protein, putative n=1 Tax=Babesia bigemina TaxID=5866 RepID=A0A061D5D7_BABBI|nr:membrane protein, putative [Babesia bigemina]CDR95921.1 membrane protein, putative [Babesia bigemina]|eukprot:XP_012768107.1 membrane protein, putative [Babesia bigemina]